MRINADFQARAAVHFDEAPWVPSPIVGVERRMLDRVGEEVARATSLVRYAPGSRFPSHVHGGGEEFLVLDGVFSDEGGDMPSGTYVRNPPGTSHAPSSTQGCVLFVKLWQFEPDDQERVKIDIGTLDLADDRHRPGVSSATLFERGAERTRVERWEPGAPITLCLPHGLWVKTGHLPPG